MKIKRFEGIETWRESTALVGMICEITKTQLFNEDYGLRDQIRCASVSVMSNIAECFDSQSNPDFMRFLADAFRSTTEVQSHLHVALDERYITEDQFGEIYKKSTKVKDLIIDFMQYLKINSKP